MRRNDNDFTAYFNHETMQFQSFELLLKLDCGRLVNKRLVFCNEIPH